MSTDAPDPPRAVRGHRRSKDWHRVSHGLHRSHDGRDLDAWALALPMWSRFTHLTAASEYGWWLPPLPGGLPVVAAIPPTSKRPTRTGLLVRRTDPVGVPVNRDGLTFDAPVDVLLQLAQDLGLLDLVAVLDSSLHLGHVMEGEVRSAAAHRKRGAPQLRRAVELCDERSESFFESLLRLLFVTAGFDVEPQLLVYDETGVLVARADLWLRATRLLPEYDGEHHLAVEQQQADLGRVRRLQDVGFERRGYTSKEVLRQAWVILRDAERATGRSMRQGAVARWHELLRESGTTAPGRARLLTKLCPPKR